MQSEFFSPVGGRPVRLPEEIRALAKRAENGEVGRSMAGSPSVSLDDIDGFERMSDVQKYTCAVMEIAKRAPLRILPGERLAGAATLDLARSHVVPAIHGGKPVFASVSHLTAGFAEAVREGLGARRAQVVIRLHDPDIDAEGREFLEGLLVCLDAVKVWHTRYLKELDRLACVSEGAERARFLEMRDRLKDVPERPPHTFGEAVQSLWFFFAFLRLCGNWPGIGRIDRILGDYLKDDLAAGRITIDGARELLAQFWIKGCEWITGEKTVSGDAQHYQNIVLSGVDENGEDVTNEVSDLVLDVIEELGISDFPVAVRVGPKTPERLLRRVAEVQRQGGGIVAVYNEEMVLSMLDDLGYEKSEARNFANDGCWEVQVPGKTCFSYVPINLLSVLQHRVLAVGEEKDVDFADFDSLYAEFLRQMDGVIGEFHRSADQFALSGQPALAVAMLTDGCIEKARDYYRRGARYYVISPHAGLLPDTANSLLAIKKIVYEEKLVTFRELRAILGRNWEGAETLRRHAANAFLYYGNDDTEADAMARRVLQDFVGCVSKVGKRAGVLRPAGVSTFGRQIDWRWDNGATADGHFKGEILSGNLSPTPGSDRNGATAIIRSHCGLGLRGLKCGTALDIRLLPASARGDEGTEAILSLIRGFVALGGIFMQIDVIDNAILLEARAHPENYQNLAVRVSGWSARFVTLSAEWQDMVIGRTAQGL